MVQTWRGTPGLDLEKRLKVWHRRRRIGYAGLCPKCDNSHVLASDLAAELGPGTTKRIYVVRPDLSTVA